LGLRILIVDDEPASVEPLRVELERRPETKVKVVNFGGFRDGITEFIPNIIVLDLAHGSPLNEDVPGNEIFDQIWTENFCPVVVYTALPSLLEREQGDEAVTHPFVKVEQKGSGSEERVIARIHEFEPHVSAIDGASVEIERTLNQALKEIAPRIFENVENADQRREMLVRSARRRVAAAMDKELSTGGPCLRSWEHYLYPPTSPRHPFTGDIIRKHGGDPGDPTQYAVVLTPSCDLVATEKRKPKVRRVLVARCREVDWLLQELTPLERKDEEERKTRLRTILTRGHGLSCLPLPALPGVFPPMTADFRDLEVIDFAEIADGKEYIRIASVDSPFRELVAWAYVSCAARPGLPDRDYDEWVDDVLAKLPEIKANA
jgi:hypothetical protein